MKIVADLSIPLRFDGPQPNAYSVERATSEPVRAGSLVGDTRHGGSVNFEQYTFTPHCNGTHTECVGHITHERISVRDCLQDVILPAVLVTVEPERESDDSYSVSFGDRDRLVTRSALVKLPGLLGGTADEGVRVQSALIVRTLPNDESKLTAEYGEANIPPYFTTEAMDYIVECGFKHLLVDMPSIDLLVDEGKLSNHRKFWNVEPGKFEINEKTHIDRTITELIYVPNEIEDGDYLLNLQIAPFESDCAPSRPILLSAN